MKNRRNIIESELPPQNHLDIWMKDGKFYRSTNKGWVLIEDQMEFTNSELMSKSTATSGTIGVNKETGEASIYNDVTKKWSPLGGGLTETTWQELKDKRDAGKLTPGALYRITDYNCTTTQENTQSAGHQFDIVLLALSENKLAEEGWAMMHENDTYFANSNLSAWKVWYCLDNDKSRFAWADDSIDETVLACITTTGNNKDFYRNKSGDVLGASFPYAWTSLENKTKYTKLEEPESGRIAISNSPNGLPANVNITFTPGHEGTGLPNGHGVIYRLIDEFDNDVPYDFKNIQYFVGNNWVYTLSKSESVGDSLPDASVVNDGFVVNNYISKQIDYMEGGEILAGNILIQSGHCSVIGVSKNNMVGGSKITLINCSDTRTMLSDSILISCSNLTPDESGFYFGNKKVLTES